MKGAREYFYPLKFAANENYNGFVNKKTRRGFFPYTPQYIQNGNFVFIFGEHSLGYELRIYMLKDPAKLNRDVIFSNDKLVVYDITRGLRGVNEEYGFIVEGIIKERVQSLLNSAVEYYKQICPDDNVLHPTTIKKRLNAKICEFEKILKE